MSDITRRDGGQQPKKNAIDLLPVDVQDQARFFYGFFSETLRGTYGIATRIRFWQKHESLTSAEAIEAMRRLMSPERSAEIDTAPKAIAALSAEVAAILRDRRAREATDRRRAKAANETPAQTEFEKLKAKIADGMNLNPRSE